MAIEYIPCSINFKAPAERLLSAFLSEHILKPSRDRPLYTYQIPIERLREVVGHWLNISRKLNDVGRPLNLFFISDVSFVILGGWGRVAIGHAPY